MAINSIFLQAAAKATFNPNKWNPEGEPVSLEDLWGVQFPGKFAQIDHIEHTTVQFQDGIGRKLRVFFKNGSTFDLSCSDLSILQDGQYVDPKTVKAQMLSKDGQSNIVRFDGSPLTV